MRHIIVAIALITAVPASAAAEDAGDRCIRKLCTGTKQMNCWVKAGAAMCDRDQVQCRDLPDHAGAKVLRKQRQRWEVVTAYGKGWVSDRMMMISGDLCPEMFNN